MSGASLKEVRDMIGHEDISMTDRYTHLPMAQLHTRQKQLHEHYQKGWRPDTDG